MLQEEHGAGAFYDMRMIVRIVLQNDPLRPTLLLLSLIVAAAVEAAGIGALLPTAGAILGESGNASQSGAMVEGIMDWIGIDSTFQNLLLLIAATIVQKSLISFAALSFAAVASADFAVGYRERLNNALFGASGRFYADQPAGKFAAAIANDATRASQAYLLAAQVLALIAQAVLLFAVALFYNWKLALASMLVGVSIGAAMNRIIRISRTAGRREADTIANLIVRIVDLLANMKVLKAFHCFGSLLLPLGRTLKKLRKTLITGEVAKLGFNLGNEVAVTLLINITAYLAYTAWNVTLPEVLAMGLIFLKINYIIAKIQKAIQQSMKYERSYERMMEQIALAEANHEPNPGQREPMPKEACRFEDVSFAHDEKEILRGVDLEFPARKITVLKGPSGAGKTTIIDLLIGLNRPGSGRITIDGVPLAEIDLFKWRRKFGYVPEELSLLHADVRENIGFGDTAISVAMIEDALRQAKALEVVTALPEGLSTSVGEMGGKISGGPRQRISLAREMVTAHEVLILDEVTSALYLVIEQDIVANIAALRSRYTIIVIIHRPAWTTIADRLYDVEGDEVRWVPNEGRLAEA